MCRRPCPSYRSTKWSRTLRSFYRKPNDEETMTVGHRAQGPVSSCEFQKDSKCAVKEWYIGMNTPPVLGPCDCLSIDDKRRCPVRIIKNSYNTIRKRMDKAIGILQ